MKTLSELIQKIDDQKRAQKALDAHYKSESDRIQKAIAQLGAQLDLEKAGIDSDKVQLGLSVIEISPAKELVDTQKALIQDAISDLATGAPRLQKEYFGLKNYAHWTHQREHHSYGSGPKHGSIVFRVGLKSPRTAPSPDQIEAALYVLLNADHVCKILHEQREAIKSGRAA